MRKIVSLVLLVGFLIPALALGQSTLINGSAVIVGSVNFCEPTGGTDSYACNLLEVLLEYHPGTLYSFKADVANSGPASLNLNSIGARTITKVQGGVTTTLVDNDIRAGQMVVVYYDGTNMQMVSQLGNAPVGGGTPGGSDTQVQYNTSGAFGGDAGFVYNATTDMVTVGVIDKGGQVYNVKAYGALCNGVADDTAEIQAAITAAEAGTKGVVYIPAGTCIISDAGAGYALRILDHRITLKGAGGFATILKMAGTGDGLVVSGQLTILEDFGLDGSSTGDDGLVLHNAGGARITNVYATAWGGDGITIEPLYTTPAGNNNSLAMFGVWPANNTGYGIKTPIVHGDVNNIEPMRPMSLAMMLVACLSRGKGGVCLGVFSRVTGGTGFKSGSPQTPPLAPEQPFGPPGLKAMPRVDTGPPHAGRRTPSGTRGSVGAKWAVTLGRLVRKRAVPMAVS